MSPPLTDDAADRLAAADPLRQCRAAHVPEPAPAHRQRARRTAGAARSCAARWCGAGRTHLLARRRDAGNRERAQDRRAFRRSRRERLSATPCDHRRCAAAAGRPRQHLDALMRPMIAIVGSRNASAAGMKFAQVAGARSGRGRLHHHLRPCARHRSGSASRQRAERHGGRARRRPQPDLSAGA